MHHYNRRTRKEPTVPERGCVINTVLMRYSKECGIKLVVLQNLLVDVVVVLVYFRISQKFHLISGT